MPKLRFAMVCAANMNRSMEAHKVLKEAGLQVESYGIGNHVKLPGESAGSPNRYDFGEVTYEDIYNDLVGKNKLYYSQKGILQMLERNMKIKPGPQKWQNSKDLNVDVAVTFEERVMVEVVKDMSQRDGSEAMLVVNMDVVDRHEDSAVAAPQILSLCKMLEDADSWEDEVDDIMERFSAETSVKPLYTVCFV